MNQEAPQATRWSIVARLHHDDDEARLEALDTLLRTYLPVLEWYLRRHPGLDAHQREDLVQGFVASKVIKQNILTRADRGRGRFRNFLLNAFQNYVRDELRRASAARRAPEGGPLLPLKEADGVTCDDTDMEREFHQAWIRQMVALAIADMQKECTENNRNDVWSIFSSRMLEPMISGAKPESYGELVQRLKLKSPGQASNLLITAKRMFSRHLHRAVQETIEDPEQAEAELQELKTCL
ncbi:MAG: hypothetical protein ISS35_04680 [Kiritimatiellae bacterium]|nr:hypothetical protein [Kiritimatiellia bacterium]